MLGSFHRNVKGACNEDVKKEGSRGLTYSKLTILHLHSILCVASMRITTNIGLALMRIAAVDCHSLFPTSTMSHPALDGMTVALFT